MIDLRDRHLIGIIGDADTVTGMLLAGIGSSNHRTQRRNYYIIDSKTTIATLESNFREMIERKDLAILLITQPVADKIRDMIDAYNDPMPALLEIPSKDQPYDTDKDSLLKRVYKLAGK